MLLTIFKAHISMITVGEFKTKLVAGSSTVQTRSIVKVHRFKFKYRGSPFNTQDLQTRFPLTWIFENFSKFPKFSVNPPLAQSNLTSKFPYLLQLTNDFFVTFLKIDEKGSKECLQLLCK